MTKFSTHLPCKSVVITFLSPALKNLHEQQLFQFTMNCISPPVLLLLMFVLVVVVEYIFPFVVDILQVVRFPDQVSELMSRRHPQKLLHLLAAIYYVFTQTDAKLLHPTKSEVFLLLLRLFSLKCKIIRFLAVLIDLEVKCFLGE